MLDTRNKVIEILLLAVDANLEENKIAKLQALVQEKNLDWDAFFQMMEKEKVQSIAANNLVKYATEALPLAILGQLRALLKKVAVNNLRKLKDLKDTLNILSKNNIPCIPWKGPLFANDLYGNATLRESVDLDILVQEKDLIKAKDILLEENYQPIWKLTEAQEDFYLEHTHSYDLITLGGQVLELHKSLAREYYMLQLSIDDFWAESQEVTFLNLSVKYPSVEHLFLAIAIHHGGRDCWIKLKLLVDWYALLCRYPDVSWNNLLSKANELGIRRILCVGTLMCNYLFDCPIPSEMEKYIKKKEKNIAGKLLDNLFAEEKITKQSYLVVALREKLYHRVLVLFKIFFSESLSDVFLSDNPVVRFVYRPIRLFKKFVLNKESTIEKEYSNL